VLIGALAVVGSAAVICAAWAWFEAGWLRTRVIEVELEGVPAELDGLRIAHLSDFHLGVPSRGLRAVRGAAAWVSERRPDLVCVTGDLVSRRSGMQELERVLGELGRCYVVLGNHDFAHSRDPFSQHVDPEAIARLRDATVLRDQAVEVELRGRRVQIVGVDPQSYAARTARPHELVDETADLRILLCHFPGIVKRTPSVFELILSGHLHAGQIVVPLPRRRLRLAHLRAQDVEGVYEHGRTKLHVSPGLGTTFVPFRFFARPEATELVVRSA
jgi:predicted MPP superfamily phosphohydrolase